MGQYLKVNSTQGINFVKELFVSTIETKSFCQNCTFINKFQTKEYMVSCALGRETNSLTLDACIDSFIHEKTNCIMCESYDCNSEKSFLILPKLLFIHLERVSSTDYGNYAKNRREVEYLPNLKLKSQHDFEHYP